MSRVHITEVGARDGLQNEKVVIPTAAKVRFIEALVAAGARQIEVGSFVSPRWVPAMADTEAVVSGLTMVDGVRYVALVPNLRGFDRARAVGCNAVAVERVVSAGDAALARTVTLRIEPAHAR